jgi:DNA polymerase-3 subunit alpha
MEIDYYNLRMDCPVAWELISSGKTKGMFQLEGSLGKHWSKKTQPCSILELSALISVIRPGVLKSLLAGKSMTQHYADRKSGEENVEYPHPATTEILEDTYGIIIYQESSIALAKHLAGYSLVEADSLRRAIGKKDAKLMQECKESFIIGCEKVGLVNNEDAEIIFDIIEKSNRYGFNKSHSVAYSVTGYYCTWVKAHFPIHFFCSWLSFAEEKMKPLEEINELIKDAKTFNIDILTPDIRQANENFTIDKSKVRFGIGNVKGIGGSQVVKTIDNIRQCELTLNKNVKDFTWNDYLFYLIPKLSKTVVNNLISVGAFSHLGLSRQQMLFEFQKVHTLTDREVKHIQDNKCKGLRLGIESILSHNLPKGKRVSSMESLHNIVCNPPIQTNDSQTYVSSLERDLLGADISCSRLDNLDTSSINCFCKDFDNFQDKIAVLAVQIDRVSEWMPKGGTKPLAFITAHDNTGPIEMMANDTLYESLCPLLLKDNTIIVSGTKSNRGSLTIKKAIQA